MSNAFKASWQYYVVQQSLWGYIIVSVKQCSTAFYDYVLWSMEVFSFNGQKAKSAEVDLKIMSLFYKVCIQFKLSDEEMIVKIFTCF